MVCVGFIVGRERARARFLLMSWVVAQAERDERDSELDQEWGELIEELRLAIPGVEVLFGFLLLLPFQRSFEVLSAAQRMVYFAALLSSAVAVLLLIAPSVNHRLRWREHDKEALLRYGTRSSITATVFIGVAMTASVYLITSLVYGAPANALVTAALAMSFTGFWYGVPLWRRLRARASRTSPTRTG